MCNGDKGQTSGTRGPLGFHEAACMNEAEHSGKVLAGLRLYIQWRIELSMYFK